MRTSLRNSGIAVGIGALTVLGALVAGSRADSGAGPADLAGSGDAPANTVYSRPSVPAMNMGATVTELTPASVPATTMAVPAVKAVG